MPKSSKAKSKAKRKTNTVKKKTYALGALYKVHYPLWDIYSKDEAVVDQWEWITTVRYKTGEYVSRLGAYPIYMTEHANTSKSLTATRVYIPSRYRPLLRLLNFKQAWHIYCLSMPEPKKPKRLVNEVVPYLERARRYEVWIDGVRRNIIYCDSIRNSFFEWIEETYYKGSNAQDIEPRVKTMDDNKSCEILENWFLHEMVVQSHIPSGINLWMSVKTNRVFMSKLRDVLNIDYNEWGQQLPWYGRIPDPRNEDDKRIISQQRYAGLDPHPVEEDIDAVRRGYGATIRTFFDTVMSDPHANNLAPAHHVAVQVEGDKDSDEDGEWSQQDDTDDTQSSTGSDVIMSQAEVDWIVDDMNGRGAVVQTNNHSLDKGAPDDDDFEPEGEEVEQRAMPSSATDIATGFDPDAEGDDDPDLDGETGAGDNPSSGEGVTGFDPDAEGDDEPDLDGETGAGDNPSSGEGVEQGMKKSEIMTTAIVATVKSAWPFIEAYGQSEEPGSLQIVNDQLETHFKPSNIPGSERVFQQARNCIMKVVDAIFPEPEEGPFMDQAREKFEELLKAITDGAEKV